MKFLLNLSIRRKQLLIILLTSSLALLLACTGVIVYGAYDFRRELADNLSILADAVGRDYATAIGYHDPKFAEGALAALRAEPNIDGACVYDRQGKVFATYQREGQTAELSFPPMRMAGYEFTDQHLHIFQTIRSNGQIVGAIFLNSNLDELPRHLRRYAEIMASVFALAMVLAMALTTRLNRLIYLPIMQLAEVTRTVAHERDYSLRAGKTGHDEVGELVDAFNEMLAQIEAQNVALRASRDTLERRVEQRTKDLQAEVIERQQAEAAWRQAEALYHSLVEQMPSGVFRKDKESRFVFVNSWFCRHRGLTAKDMLGKTSMELAAEETSQQHPHFLVFNKYAAQGEEHHKLILETGRQIEVEEEYPGRGGRTLHVQVVKSPVFGPDGAIIGTQGLMFDITARKRAEAELACERDLLRSMLDNFPDSIYFKDLESRFVRVSKSKLMKTHAACVEQYRSGAVNGEKDKLPPHLADLEQFRQYIIGKTDFDFNPEEVARARYEGEQEIIRTAKPQIGRLGQIRQPDGTSKWELSTKMPWRDKDGNIVGTFGITTDITALKEAEARLTETSNLMNALLANSADYIYFKDLESRFTRCSDSVVALHSQRGVEDMLGKTDADVSSAEHAASALADEQQIIRTGEPIIGKTERETWPDGRVTWALTSKMPLRNANNEIVGTFGITKNITPLKEAEAKLNEVHRNLVETSRQAGMAEVATSVLHNVGNVLNSVNTSAGVITERLRKSRVSGISRVIGMFEEHKDDLAGFLNDGDRLDQLVNYLKTLAQHLLSEQTGMLGEVQELAKNIEHIKEIVAMQQSYARVTGVREVQSVPLLVEDALRMHGAALDRHEVHVVRDYKKTPEIPVDKHKVLQVLVNLISNAKYAMADTQAAERVLTLGVDANDDKAVRITISDRGVGIPPENLTRIFSLGFTTREDGHGFGLHSGFLAAREMGGNLHVRSEGPGRGATFTLELPVQPE